VGIEAMCQEMTCGIRCLFIGTLFIENINKLGASAERERKRARARKTSDKHQ